MVYVLVGGGILTTIFVFLTKKNLDQIGNVICRNRFMD